MKKLLAFLLALIMVCSLFPASVLAEETEPNREDPYQTYGNDYPDWQSWWYGSTQTFYWTSGGYFNGTSTTSCPDPVGHDWQQDDTYPNTENSCSSMGVLHELCANCSSARTTYYKAEPHIRVPYAEPDQHQDPTCTDAGWNKYKCQHYSECGQYEEEELPALGHSWVRISSKKPTATRPGEIVYQCTRCRERYTEELPCVSSYTYPDQLMSGPGSVGTFSQFSNLYHYNHGVIFPNVGWDPDSLVDINHVEGDTLYLLETDYKYVDSDTKVMLVFANYIPNDRHPYIDIQIDAWEEMDVYLINFGTSYYEPGVGYVARTGLRNIFVNGSGVRVFLVNSNIGFIDYMENDQYVYPIYDGSSETGSVALRLQGYDSFLKMGGDVNSVLPGTVHCTIYEDVPIYEDEDLQLHYNPDNPYYPFYFTSRYGRWGADFSYAPSIEAANMTVDALGTMTTDENTGTVTYTDGRLTGIGGAKLINCSYQAEQFQVDEFALLGFENSTVEIGTIELHNRAQLTVGGSLRSKIVASGTNKIRMVDGTLYGSILAAAVTDDAYGTEDVPGSDYNGQHYIEVEYNSYTQSWSRHYYKGARVDLLLGGESYIELPTYDEYDKYDLGIMVDHEAVLVVNDDTEREGVGSLTVRCEYNGFPYYPFTSIGGSASMEPETHGWIFMQGGILNLRGYNGGAALGGSAIEPDEYWEYLGEVGSIPEPELGDYIRIQVSDGSYYGVMPTPGYCCDGGRLTVYGGVINAEAEYGGAGVGGAKYGNAGVIDIRGGGSVNAKTNGGAAAIGGGDPAFEEDYVRAGYQMLRLQNSNIYVTADGGGNLIYAVSGDYNGHTITAGQIYDPTLADLEPYWNSVIFKKLQRYVSGGGSGKLTIRGGSSVTAWADNPLYDQSEARVDLERNVYHDILPDETYHQSMNPYQLTVLELYYNNGVPYYRFNDIGYTEYYFAEIRTPDGYTYELTPVDDLLPDEGYPNGREPGYVIGSSCGNVITDNRNLFSMRGGTTAYSTVILGQNDTNQYNSYMNPKKESAWDHYYLQSSEQAIQDPEGYSWYPSQVDTRQCVVLQIGYHWEGDENHADFEGYQVRHNLAPQAYTLQGYITLPSVEEGLEFDIPKGTTLKLSSGSILDVGENTNIFEDPEDENQLVLEEGAVIVGKGYWPGKPADPENPPTTDQIRSLLERIENFSSGGSGSGGSEPEQPLVVTHLGVVKTNDGKLVIPGYSADEIRQRMAEFSLDESLLLTIFSAGDAGFKREISADGTVVAWSLANYSPDVVVSLLENGSLVASPGPYSLLNNRFNLIVTESGGGVSAILKSPVLSTPEYAVFEGTADEEIELKLQAPGSEYPFKVELDADQVRNNKCIFSVPKFGESEFSINTISPLRNKCAVRFAGRMSFSMLISDVAGVNIEQLQLNYNDADFPLGGVKGGGCVNIPDIGGFPVNGSAKMNINTFAPNRMFSLDVELETPIFSGAFRGTVKEARGVMLLDTLYAEMAVGKGGIPLVPPTVFGYLQGGGLGFSGFADTVAMDSPGTIPLRLEISSKASLMDVISGWARVSVGPSGFDLTLEDIKIADYEWIKELGASATMGIEERTIKGIKYWGYNTDMSTYFVVGIPLHSLGYGNSVNEDETVAGLSAKGSVGIGSFAGYKKVNESDGTYLYFIYQLRASGSLSGSLTIPKHIVGGIIPSKNMTIGNLAMGFYAEANAKNKVNVTEVADTGSPRNLLNQLSKNVDLDFDVAIGAKASAGVGHVKFYVRVIYVLGQKDIDVSYGTGDGGTLDLSGAIGNNAVSTSGYDTTLTTVRKDGSEEPIPAIVQTGAYTAATLGSGPVRGAEDTVSMVLNPDGTVTATVNQALAGNVILCLKLDQMVDDLSAANVTVNNGAVTLISDVYNENGESTVYNANFCVSSGEVDGNEVSAICFVPYAAGTYTIVLNNTTAAFTAGQAIVTTEFASFDPAATELGADSLSYTVCNTAENGRYKIQVFLGDEEGQGDFLLAETDELTASTLSDVLNVSFNGNLAPSGSYYPSILLLEYVDAVDEAGQSLGTWAAIDQINLTETRTYTNNDEIAAPAEVNLSYYGNGSMSADWTAVSGADSYRLGVYQEVANTTWDEEEQAFVTVEGTHWEDTGLTFETAETSIIMDLSSLYGDPAESRNVRIGVRAVRNVAATIQDGDQEIIDTESETQYKTGREGLSEAAELTCAVPLAVTYSDNVHGEENSLSVAANINGAVFTVTGPEDRPLTIIITNNQTGEILLSENEITSLEVAVPAPTEENTASVLTLDVKAVDPTTGDFVLDTITVNFDTVAPPIILDNLGRYAKWGTDFGYHAEITGHTEAGASVCIYSIKKDDWGWDYEYELLTIQPAAEDGSFSVPMNFTGDAAFCVQALDDAGNQSVALIVEFPDSEIVVNLDPNGGSCAYSSIGFDSGLSIGELPTASGSEEGDVFDCWYMNVESSVATEIEGMNELVVTEVEVTPDMVFNRSENGKTVVSAADGTVINTYDGDVLLFARWAEGVTLTLVPGEDAACDTETRLCKPGSALGNLPVPRRTDGGNDLFLGWYSGETKYTDTSVINGDLTLTARWMPAVTVTFDPGLGDLALNGDDPELAEAFSKGSSLVIPAGSAIAAYPTASATGYTFDGWFKGDEAVQSSDVYNEDTTLTAHWTRITAPLAVSQTGCREGELLPDPVYTAPAEMTGDPLITYSRSVAYQDDNGETQYKTYSSTAKPTKAGHYTVSVECNTFETVYVGSAEFNIIGSLMHFTDVSEQAYYYDPVLWAIENGITAGTSDTTFSPNQPCTRAQIVTFLYRACADAAYQPGISELPFNDVPQNAYYYDAVRWAVENGTTIGTSSSSFSPSLACTRAQAVTFIWRALGSPAPTQTDTSFTDVSETAWYRDAVLWAVENGITVGTSDTTFSPNRTCTRAQIVTFLWHAVADGE